AVTTCQARQCNGIVSASVPSQSKISPLICIMESVGACELPNPSRLHGCELCFNLIGHQWIDNRIEISFDECGKIIQGHVDAVIGHAILWEIVGADLLGAFASADLRLTLRGVFRVFFGDLAFEEARPKDS